MSNTVTIGTYIVNRLKEIGIDTIFGVPGDCTLTFLDIIEDDPDVTWGNNTNELNAAYAADGYARIKGVAALCTVMGVGELSALNGVAGSYAEHVPIIHIVGYCSTNMRDKGAILHHTLGNGDLDVFSDVSSKFAVASTTITVENALSEIDRIIETACRKKRPGYINLPINLVHTPVPVPSELPRLQLELVSPTNDHFLTLKKAILSNILECLHNAKNPVVIVDFHVLRYQLEVPVNDFIERSGFPAFCTPMGKGVVYSHLPNYHGVFFGKCTDNGALALFENADLIIEFGSLHSDMNTASFTGEYNQEKIITLNVDSISVYYTEYLNIGLQEMLPLLLEAAQSGVYTAITPDTTTVDSLKVLKKEVKDHRLIDNTKSTALTQEFLWDALPHFVKENSIIISEVGCAMYGALNTEFPGNYTKFITQCLWMSIGYTVPAALGAAMADRSKTVYLLVGDGSFQLTGQEVSAFIRHGITPVIILINNDGYLIEKVINGPLRSYNNFKMWKYSKSLDYFGGHLEINGVGAGKKPSPIGVEARVETCQGFVNAMKRVQEEPNKIHFVELVFSQFDTPSTLRKYINVLADVYN
ncbi:unnamed protein product [Mucor hiemalis]